MKIVWHTYIFILFFLSISLIDAHLHQIGTLLHGTGMKKFPSGSFEHTKAINFLNNNFTELAPYTFYDRKFNKLEKVILRANNIRYINPQAFAMMSKITQLDLYGNNLTTFHKHSFQGLTALKTLHLGKNLIKVIDEEVLKPLTSLEKLDLSENSLRTLKITFLKDTTTSELNLNNNPLVISEHHPFLDSSNLIELDLQSCNLEKLPTNTFSLLPNLEVLDLSKNKLQTLPDGLLKHAPHLQYLDLSFNSITLVSVNVFHLPTDLDVLHCNENPLQHEFDCAQLLVTMHSEYVEQEGKDDHQISETVTKLDEEREKDEPKSVSKAKNSQNTTEQALPKKTTVQEEKEDKEGLKPVTFSDVQINDVKIVHGVSEYDTKNDFGSNNAENEGEEGDDFLERTGTALIYTIIVVSVICLLLVIVLVGELYYLIKQHDRREHRSRFAI